jgi:hypothetical protein
MAFRLFKRLRDLLDVDFSTFQDGDRVVYHAATDQFVGMASAGGATSADDVTFTPAGNIAATDAQAAIEELDSEKAATSHVHSGADITSGTVADARIDSAIARDSEVTSAVAAEATARDAAIAAHEADTTNVHGIADTSALDTVAARNAALTTSEAGQVRDGDAAGGVLAGTYPSPSFAVDMATQAELDAVSAAQVPSTRTITAGAGLTGGGSLAADRTLDVQVDASTIEIASDTLRVKDGGITSAKIADGTITTSDLAFDPATQTELDAHLNDTVDAHDASAISFSPTGTIASTDVQAAIAEVASEAGSGGAANMTWESRSTNTILAGADKGKAIEITAAITQTLTAAATLGAGWWAILANATGDGTTVVTLDPNSSELVDGLSTLTMYSGEVRLILCDGSAFQTELLHGGFAKFTANGNFVVPPGATAIQVDCIGGGGGGGSEGNHGPSGWAGGSGGGGGSRFQRTLAAEKIGAAAGSTVAVVVGSGGSGGAAGGANGGAGGTTTFGSIARAHGGGGGGGNASSVRNGGTGGGVGETGGTGGAGTGIGGMNVVGGNIAGIGGAGGGNINTDGAAGKSAEWGGGAGGTGHTNNVGGAGGSSLHGAAGGAGAGGSDNNNGGAGGSVGQWTAGGGAAGGTSSTDPANGADGDTGGGGGGGYGNTGASTASRAKGGAGGVPGGGGGGSAVLGSNTPAGGDGARGEVRIRYW